MDEGKLILSYNLQFFADGDGGEKTEEATAKKLEDTRKKGQVAKSQELSNALELITLFILLRAFSSFMGERFTGLFTWLYGSQIAEIVSSDRSGLTVSTVSRVMIYSILQLLLISAPFMIGGILVAFLSNVLQFQFKVTTEPLKPSLDKFNPVNGFRRMFSRRALFNLLLSIVKVALIFVVAYYSIRSHANELFVLYDLPVNQSVALVGDVVIDTGLRISLVYLVVGFADFFYQRYKFRQDTKMTKQEVKDEFKDSEGDPQIKSQQRQRMREASQRRMMQSVPEADVVITNPTHIAVAIKYDREVAAAPVVLAKGEEYLAQKIKDIARENHVDIVENKPLARAIYTTVDIGDAIPPELYQAVAEILAVIYNRRQ